MAAKKEERIDLSRRGFLTGFRRLKKQDPEEERAPQASLDETFAVLQKANEAFRDEDWETALDLYKEFLKEEPRNADARYRQGRCLYHLEKYIQAKVEFERVLRERRDDKEAMIYLGLSLARLNKPGKAAVIWQMYFDPEAIPVQRAINVQLAFLESDEVDAPEGPAMADAVEAALAEWRRQKTA
ncbi:MAG: tetratricopeptide repeat protein [Desulfovibrionaceae bacterium]